MAEVMNRLERLEDRVESIEDAIIDLKISVGGIVSEIRLLRYTIIIMASLVFGVDMSGMI